jgi:hypothetical protein
MSIEPLQARLHKLRWELALAFTVLLVYALAIGAIGYVAIHFIVKYW